MEFGSARCTRDERSARMEIVLRLIDRFEKRLVKQALFSVMVIASVCVILMLEAVVLAVMHGRAQSITGIPRIMPVSQNCSGNCQTPGVDYLGYSQWDQRVAGYDSGGGEYSPDLPLSVGDSLLLPVRHLSAQLFSDVKMMIPGFHRYILEYVAKPNL